MSQRGGLLSSGVDAPPVKEDKESIK